MEETKVVQLFEVMDEQVLTISSELNEPYLDSLSILMEALYYETVQSNIPTSLKEELEEYSKKVEIGTYALQEIHRAIQLLILKGMQKTTQHQHVITPEAIALFIGYLAEKLSKNMDTIRIFDPVSGSGNLLFTVMNNLKQNTTAYASEVDITLLRIALLSANLLQKEIEFFHQDSLRPLFLDPVDLVIADLPVGYYPDDEQAADYELKSENGHSYAHHLLIEQSLHYTKPGGFLIFVIPETLFSSDQSENLNKFIQQHAHIIGLIQLSETTFKSKSHSRSIFILQKKGDNTNNMQQPLLVKLPSFKNTTAMEDIMQQINQWFQQSGLHK